MSKSEPVLDEDAVHNTLEGPCHQVSVAHLPPVQTFIHDKDHVIITQGEDMLVLHCAMLVKIVNHINKHSNPANGDFIPMTSENLNVH